MVVFALGKNLLFKSVLGHCDQLSFFEKGIIVQNFLLNEWALAFEKKPLQFWREIWIQVVVILLQLYQASIRAHRSTSEFALQN